MFAGDAVCKVAIVTLSEARHLCARGGMFASEHIPDSDFPEAGMTEDELRGLVVKELSDRWRQPFAEIRPPHWRSRPACLARSRGSPSVWSLSGQEHHTRLSRGRHSRSGMLRSCACANREFQRMRCLQRGVIKAALRDTPNVMSFASMS